MELTVHAEIEEEIVYPAVRRNVDGGRRLASHAEQEHQQVKQMLDQLADMDPDSREAEALIPRAAPGRAGPCGRGRGPPRAVRPAPGLVDDDSLKEMGAQVSEARLERTIKNPAPEAGVKVRGGMWAAGPSTFRPSSPAGAAASCRWARARALSCSSM